MYHHYSHAFTGLWWEHGVAAVAEQARLFFAAYAKAGGQLDELVLDWEEGMFSPHYSGPCPAAANASDAAVAVTARCLQCMEERYAIVEADPRWPAALAELQELGFKLDADNSSLAATMGRYHCVPSEDARLRAGAPPCSSIDGVGARGGHDANAVWFAWVVERGARYFAQALLAPARRHFPDVRFSSYELYSWDSRFCEAPAVSGFFRCNAGRGATAVSVGAPLYYDEWVDFDCRPPLTKPSPSNQYPTDSAAYCESDPGVSRALANLWCARPLASALSLSLDCVSRTDRRCAAGTRLAVSVALTHSTSQDSTSRRCT